MQCKCDATLVYKMRSSSIYPFFFPLNAPPYSPTRPAPQGFSNSFFANANCPSRSLHISSTTFCTSSVPFAFLPPKALKPSVRATRIWVFAASTVSANWRKISVRCSTVGLKQRNSQLRDRPMVATAYRAMGILRVVPAIRWGEMPGRLAEWMADSTCFKDYKTLVRVASIIKEAWKKGMKLTAVSQTSTNKALPLVVTDAKAFKCNVPGVSGKVTLTESKRAIYPINNLYLPSLV